MIKRDRLYRAIEALESRRLLAAVGPDGFGYAGDAYAYEDIDLVPGAAGVVSVVDSIDDGTGAIALGTNTFNFYGTAYTGSASLYASSNGLLTFGSANIEYSNSDLTSVPSQRAIAVLWDDLTTAQATSGATNDVVLYKIDAATNRLIVEWNNIPHLSSPSTGDATFQVILQLNTGPTPGTITLNYRDLIFGNATYNNGGTATIGIKDTGTQSANRLLVSQNSGSNPLIGSSKAIRFAKQAGTITGVKFEDRNGNGSRDVGEPGLAGWTIYLDNNDNGQLDGGEQSTTSDASGNYSLSNVPTGSRTLREVPQSGWIQTAPLVSGASSGSAPVESATAAQAEQFGVIAGRDFTRTEVIVAAPGREALANLKKTIGGGTKGLRELFDLDRSTTLSRGKKQSMLELKLKPGADVLAAVALLNKTAGVEWAAPNYVYRGPDPRELTPNDPSYGSQWFHTKMQNNLAWDTTQGEGVVVAITDDGTDWDHVDLAANIWSNSDEIAGNGVDDDLNGFVDDVRGWDFVGNDNNPDHAGSDSHGTHVAGIIAGRTNNAVGIAGTAGRVQLMPVRFYSSTLVSWTSTHVFNAYKYAIDNGAKIVSTSYNVDGFVGDPTFVAAINYIYNAGGLHFNSAGNTSTLNPARQVYDQTLYVAATNSSDVRSSFSNYGTGIDIAAPGESIYSTLPNNSYGSNSGTSMATPNAAASAALVWSAHPTWTRDQVAAQVLGTADNIDGINPSYATLLGTGRVNSFRGVTSTLGAPKFRGVTGLPADNAVTLSSPSSISFDLFSVLEPSAMNSVANFELRSDGADDVFGNGDDAIIPLTLGTTYRIATNKFNVAINGGSLPAERYRFRAISGAGALRDPFGTPLDGNGDGTGGDAFTRTFTIAGKPAARIVNVTPNATTSDVSFGDFPTVFTGTFGANAYVLSGDNSGNIDLWVDQDPQATPTPTYTIARGLLPTLNIYSAGGDDSLVLDYFNGNPIPNGGVTLNGAGGNDVLVVRGTSGDDVLAFDLSSIVRTGSSAATRLGMETVTFSVMGGEDDLTLAGAGTVVNIPAAQHLARLNVGVGSTARVTPGGNQALAVNALTVDGSLDLTDNDLVIDYIGASVLGTFDGSSYTDVTGQVASGAIYSSLATPGLTTLGVAESAATGTWSGVTVDASAVLIKYTYAGDANLDGLVSGDDYTMIDFAIAVPGSSLWQNGDFNLDGVISGDDYTAIDFAIAAQGTPL